MDVHFLQARMALTKRFELVNSLIVKHPYPNAAEFRSHVHQISHLGQLFPVLQFHASNGHCLLKGRLTKKLDFERRAGCTSPNEPSGLGFFDLDQMLSVVTPDEYMARMGLPDLDYIVQYSASHGIVPNSGLSCHIFYLLAEPVAPAVQKQWLIHKNLNLFRDEIQLTKTNCALHWSLDPTAAQNDKLIFISPPQCTPATLDPLDPTARLVYVQKGLTHLVFPYHEVPTAAANRAETEALISELRAKKGLPARKKFSLKTLHGEDYLPDPDQATMTGVRKERGFVYFNLNGGDSWAYYHPENKPDFIYNFKDEPVYLTKELLPDYWRDLRRENQTTRPSERRYLAFRDILTDQYYNGWADENGEVCLLPAGNKDKLVDFLVQHGEPKPDFIPDWECRYEPLEPARLDHTARKVNLFQPTPYMQGRHLAPACPPTIHALICNVIGSDPGLIDHFINWLAVAWRERVATGTAWIWQGVPGTGKGLFLHEIIVALFGLTNVVVKRMEELEERFNGYLENTLLCFIDEVQVGISKRADLIMANLKNQITEPVISVRRMYQQARVVKNHVSWILASNMLEPVQLAEEDRRYNVGEFCRVPLAQRLDDSTDAFVAQLRAELPLFADYLRGYAMDAARARRVFRNTARADLIEASQSSVDAVARALLDGRLEELYDYATEGQLAGMSDAALTGDAYSKLIKELVLTNREVLSREDIRLIFTHCCGRGIPESPAKFTKFLKHKGISIEPVHSPSQGKTLRGFRVHWQSNPDWLKDLQGELSQNKVVPISAGGTGPGGILRKSNGESS